MAGVKRLGRDLRDALHASADRDARRMAAVHRREQVLKARRIGVVLIHADLLLDDAALLVHAFVREIRRRHHPQQNFQVFFKAVGAFDIIRRHGVVRKRIVAAAVFGVLLHGVSLRQIEHLMLQIVRHARRNGTVLSRKGKAHIDRAEVRRQKREFFRKARPRNDADGQSVRQLLFKIVLAKSRKVFSDHASAPFRK